MSAPNKDQLAELQRFREALVHVATGGISPSIGFAQRILLGRTVAEAHAEEAARMFGDTRSACASCRDMGKIIDFRSRTEAVFYDCPDCSERSDGA